MPTGTFYGWMRLTKSGGIDLGYGEKLPETVLTLAAEPQLLKKQEKKIKRLKEENEFLADVNAFFAASLRKSGKKND